MPRRSFETHAYSDSSDSSAESGSEGESKKKYNVLDAQREKGAKARLTREKEGVNRNIENYERREEALRETKGNLHAELTRLKSGSAEYDTYNQQQKEAFDRRTRTYEADRTAYNTQVDQFNAGVNNLRREMSQYNGKAHNHNKQCKDRNNRVEGYREAISPLGNEDKMKSLDQELQGRTTRLQRTGGLSINTGG